MSVTWDRKHSLSKWDLLMESLILFQIIPPLETWKQWATQSLTGKFSFIFKTKWLLDIVLGMIFTLLS